MKFYFEEFRKLRKQARWTIPQMKKVCGVSHATLSRWETGVHKPSESDIRMLSNVLSIPIEKISDYNKSDSLANEMKGKTKTLHALSETNSLEFSAKENEIIKGIKEQSSKLRTASLIISALINTMESAFYIKDAENRYIIANNAFLDIVDIPKYTNIEGWTDSDFFPENEAKEAAKEDKNILDQPGERINRETYIPGTRKKRWGLITKVPILNSDNKIEGMICTIKDITEQKAAEETRKLLEDALNKINVGITLFDPKKNKCTYANKAVSELYGIPEEKFKTQGIFDLYINDLIHPDDREEKKKFFENSAPDISDKRQDRIIHKDKGIRWLEVHRGIQEYKNKKTILNIAADITEQKKSILLQQIMIDNIAHFDICFSLKDIDSQEIIYSSKNYFDCLGFSDTARKIKGDKLVAYWLNNIVHPDDKAINEKYYKERKFPKYRQYSFNHPQKGLRWLEVYISNPFAVGNKNYECSFAVDITDRKHYSIKYTQ